MNNTGDIYGPVVSSPSVAPLKDHFTQMRELLAEWQTLAVGFGIAVPGRLAERTKAILEAIEFKETCK